ncbi:hypothetical protein M427DRAFT_119692 [Gonapodya prolifera JEL478]|uniref:Methyltransferase domain-containing protein n=1 Tax=Gonapodya prolifera (strain JEL478) TaxID=1344416 RepID=A0A139AUW6_GONPJ|nr:hypothetical protein M427DRAFT_119692 [Gonapodya prolifera JEL478]|eukprot:KXS20536.1 hypothetical protein M427DRAFT_119692 [Gonapodya prolifera JEL478]
MTHYAYRCIAELTFLYPRIATNPVYASVLQTRMSTPNDVSLPFLDLGTCFGNDLRKLSLDGYPESDLFGLDVDEQFWKLGLELYDSPIHGDRVEEGAAGSKLTYLLGDILDDTFLTPDTSETSATESLPFPITRNYSPRNIDHLKGHFRFIHAGSLLHLFTKSTVPLLLRKTLSLLQPGGLYFGRTVGIPGDGVEGTDMRKEGVFGKESQLGYLHTRHSLANAFRDAGFVDVKVEAMPSKAGAGHKNGGGKPAEGSGVVLTFLLFEGRRAGSTE